MSEHFKFGGGPVESTLHPALLVAMIVAAILMLTQDKRKIATPFLLLAFLVPYGQQLYLGGVHVSVIRFLLLPGLVRMFMGKRGKWDPIDKLFLPWAVLRSLAFVLLYMDGGAVTNQLGIIWDYLGAFFLLRFLIDDKKAVERVITTLAVVAAVIGICMLNEKVNAINVFAYFTGGSLAPTVRDGAIRAQGPFAHAILAGTFGATLLPLFVWFWIGGYSKAIAVVGVIASTLITLTSASSTPLLGYAAGMAGMCLWPLRDHLSVFRRSFVGLLAVLSVLMKAPVWFLIAHVDLVGGSSGYHRAMLIDQFITHFKDWFLIGTNANGTWGWDMWDTCNQYVTEGYTGGLATLIFFLALIVRCFKRLGVSRRVTRDTNRQWYLWLLGVALFSHVVAFFGIVYFDQTQILWFVLLALITNATPQAAALTSGSVAKVPTYAAQLTSARQRVARRPMPV